MQMDTPKYIAEVYFAEMFAAVKDGKFSRSYQKCHQSGGFKWDVVESEGNGTLPGFIEGITEHGDLKTRLSVLVQRPCRDVNAWGSF